MPALSAVIITRNEEKNIARCLKPLQGWIEDILVIDAHSTDKTCSIARQYGARVITKNWKGYSQNKNFGNQQAKNDWILSLDADEVLSAELVEALQKLALAPDTVYQINRLTNFCGQWIYHSNWHPDWNIRLFNRQTARWTGDYVHEQLSFPADIKVASLPGLLYHYSYENHADHWERIERYARLSALQLYQNGKKATFLQCYLSPAARWFTTYFIKKGFLDGRAGWTISVRNAWLVWRKYQLLKKLSSSQEHEG